MPPINCCCRCCPQSCALSLLFHSVLYWLLPRLSVLLGGTAPVSGWLPAVSCQQLWLRLVAVRSAGWSTTPVAPLGFSWQDGRDLLGGLGTSLLNWLAVVRATASSECVPRLLMLIGAWVENQLVNVVHGASVSCRCRFAFEGNGLSGWAEEERNGGPGRLRDHSRRDQGPQDQALWLVVVLKT